MSQDEQTVSMDDLEVTSEDSTTSIEQPAIEAQSDAVQPTEETQEVEQQVDAAPEISEETDQAEVQQPTEATEPDSALAKAQAAAKRNAIENRKAKREMLKMQADMEALKASQIQQQQPVQPAIQATPNSQAVDTPSDATGIPEDVMYDPIKLSQHIAQQAQLAVQADRQQRETQQQQAEVTQNTERFWNQSDELAAEDPEYAKNVDQSHNIMMSESLRMELISSDNGAKVHRHLLENPADISRLNRLDPVSTAREFARIESRLSMKSQGRKKQPSVTSAPNPPNVVKGSAVTTNDNPHGLVFDH